MTVLSDSIHIGSMSPSKTIHFGPLWVTLASSRIIFENRPVGKQFTLGTLDSLTLAINTLHWSVFLHNTIITIFPLSGCWVDDAKKLVIGHSLWVKVRPHRSALHVLIGPLEWPHHLTLSSSRVPDHKHGVTHGQQLLQLHHLTHRYTTKHFILCSVYSTWRTLVTWYNNKQWPFYSGRVDNVAFHGPLHCSSQSTASQS